MTDLEPESHHAPNAGELRRILHELVQGQHTTNRHLTRLDKKMTDGLANLQQSVTDLQTTDNAVLAALGGGVQQLLACGLAVGALTGTAFAGTLTAVL